MSSLLEFINQNSAIILLIALILLILLIATAIFLFVENQKMRNGLRHLFRGAHGISLEETIYRIVDENRELKEKQGQNRNSIDVIKENLLTSYRKIGIVKYNAFPGMAGKMSASICLLNNEENGFIITIIHGQEGCYTYVKEVMNGKSLTPLTKEDEEALSSALNM